MHDLEILPFPQDSWLKAGTAEYLLNWQSWGIRVRQPDVHLDTDSKEDQSNWAFPYMVILPPWLSAQIKPSPAWIYFLLSDVLTQFELVFFHPHFIIPRPHLPLKSASTSDKMRFTPRGCWKWERGRNKKRGWHRLWHRHTETFRAKT